MTKPALHSFEGQQLTLQQIAKALDLKYQTFMSLRARNPDVPYEQLSTLGRSNARLYSFEGQDYTLKDVSPLVGYKYSTLAARRFRDRDATLEELIATRGSKTRRYPNPALKNQVKTPTPPPVEAKPPTAYKRGSQQGKPMPDLAPFDPLLILKRYKAQGLSDAECLKRLSCYDTTLASVA